MGLIVHGATCVRCGKGKLKQHLDYTDEFKCPYCKLRIVLINPTHIVELMGSVADAYPEKQPEESAS